MRPDDVAVVVPVYKPVPARAETLALTQLRNTLGDFPVVFVCGESFDLEGYHVRATEAPERFADACFRDKASFSRLMLSDDFYERFSQFEYLLVHHLDAYVFQDRLLEFCEMGFDYIGAVWPNGVGQFRHEFLGDGRIEYLIREFLAKRRVYVGNGGFSLRRVAAIRAALTRNEPQRRSNRHSEDFFLAKLGWIDVQFEIAPPEVAMSFAFEGQPRRVYALNGRRLPFGIHAWEHIDPEFARELMKLAGGIVIDSESR